MRSPRESRAELGAQQQARAMRPCLHRGDRNIEIRRRFLDGQALDFPQHEHGAEGQRQAQDRVLEGGAGFLALDAEFRIPERSLCRYAFDG